MTYENTSHKLVIVFDRNRSPEVLLNAGAHVSLGLGTLLQSLAKPLSYAAPGLGVTATISEHPIILLEANSSTQLMNLLVKVRTTDEATYNIFAHSMLGRPPTSSGRSRHD